MPSIPEDELDLEDLFDRIRGTCSDCEHPGCHRTVSAARKAIHQYAAKARIDELERKMILHIEAMSSADYKAGFQDALDQIDKANHERIKQLKEGQE